MKSISFTCDPEVLRDLAMAIELATRLAKGVRPTRVAMLRYALKRGLAEFMSECGQFPPQHPTDAVPVLWTMPGGLGRVPE